MLRERKQVKDHEKKNPSFRRYSDHAIALWCLFSNEATSKGHDTWLEET